MFPQPGAVVAGARITLDAWLKQPTRVQRAITDLTLQRFVADQIFGPGPDAPSGVVLFDQVLNSILYTSTRDVQEIEPGSEFPLVDFNEAAPSVARTAKRGGAFIITYEERDRNATDVLARRLTRLRNTIVRKHDAVAIATLKAAPIQTLAASGNWQSTAFTGIQRDLIAARTQTDKLDMGYVLDTALVSPTNAGFIEGNDKIASLLPREAVETNPILAARLLGVAGIKRWVVSNRIGDDEVLIVASGQVGSISDEKALYSRVVDQQAQERLLVMAARTSVPYVTDPKACVRITGVNV